MDLVWEDFLKNGNIHFLLQASKMFHLLWFNQQMAMMSLLRAISTFRCLTSSGIWLLLKDMKYVCLNIFFSV